MRVLGRCGFVVAGLLGLAAAASLASACGGDQDTRSPPDAGDPDAGDAASPTCPAGQSALDGGACRPPGVPPEACAKGFRADDAGGCDPIMPPTACPKGLIAVPGDTTCREVMPCGPGKWGDIPIEIDTVFVDASFTGTSDGSGANPWKSLHDGVAAAPSGALIAVAEGTYQGSAVVVGKSVRIWGVCPSKVNIVGQVSGDIFAAVEISKGSNSEIHGVSITGPSAGFATFDSTGVLVDRIWVHDTTGVGVSAQSDPGGAPMDLRVTGSLIEFATKAGILGASATATVEATAVRDTQSPMGVADSAAVAVLQEPGVAATSVFTLRGLSLERNVGVGVEIANGSSGTVDGCWITGGVLSAGVNTGAQVMGPSAAGGRPSMKVRASVLDGNPIVAGAAVLDVEDTVVRNTQQDDSGGSGIDVESIMAVRTTATVARCLVDRAQAYGIQSIGSDVAVSGTVVRRTLQVPGVSNGSGMLFIAQDSASRGVASVVDSLVEDNASGGVVAAGVDFTFDHAESSHNQQGTLAFGDGLAVFDQGILNVLVPATATITSSVFRDNYESGIYLGCAGATITDVIASDTKASSGGAYGDGISIVATPLGTAPATLTRVQASGNKRAGIASFDASVNVGSATLTCNGFDLDEEGAKASFDDQGDNVCGCNGKTAQCVALSTDLTPPPVATLP